MSLTFDPVVTNSGRLRILTALAAGPESAQEFMQLRRTTRLTDGNLATHAKRLQAAGFVSIDKRERAGRPVTTIHLTPQGRQALRAHVEQLTQALSANRDPRSNPDSVAQDSGAWTEDWID